MRKDDIHEIIIKHLPMGYSVVDEKGAIVEFNNIAEEITGYSKDEVMGRSHLDIFHSTFDKDACPLMKQTLTNREDVIATEASIRNKNGDTVTLLVTAFPFFDESGHFMGGVELFRDISESKRLKEEQKNILSMFAHDMKNPIVTASGFLMRFLSGKAGPLTEKQKEYLELIIGDLNTLEGLIKNFLEFSRLESKEYKPVYGPFDLIRAIEKHIKALKAEADKKNIGLSFEYPEEISPVINCDADMITRVINNLLDNAIKYTDAEGAVTVKLSAGEEDVLIQIMDTGIGIPEKHLPHVFNAFYRASKDSTGSGLGLSIVKAIIEAHGGKIWAESSIGKGSTFNVILPKKKE